MLPWCPSRSILTRTFYIHFLPIPDPPATKDSNDQTLPGLLDANSMLRDKNGLEPTNTGRPVVLPAPRAQAHTIHALFAQL